MKDSEGRFMVSTGTIIKNINTGKYLLLKKPEHDNWTYLSGRMKQGENIEDALKREIFEETGLTGIKIIKLLSAWHGYRGEQNADNELIVLSFLCSTENVNIKLSNEHSNFIWVDGDGIRKLIKPGLFDSIKDGLS